MNVSSDFSWLAAMGTLQVATNCFFTALNWTTGKLTVVCARLVSVLDDGNCVDQFLLSTAARDKSRQPNLQTADVHQQRVVAQMATLGSAGQANEVLVVARYAHTQHGLLL
jgi:hypothetical protein